MSFSYSLYIPRVFKGVIQEQIRGTFYGKSIGKVSRVDLLKVYNEKNAWVYNKAFVHFDEWFANDTSIQLKSDIDAGSGGAKLNYDGERFWMLLPNVSDSVPSEEQNNTVEESTSPAPQHQAQQHQAQQHQAQQHQAQQHQAQQPMMYPTLYNHIGQPLIPQYIVANPYGYLEPPADIGNRDRYYSNYTAHHHAYFSPQFPQQQNGDLCQAPPRLGAPAPITNDPN
jgi:hypothetical protein